jgi:hypothetical protein
MREYAWARAITNIEQARPSFRYANDIGGMIGRGPRFGGVDAALVRSAVTGS